MNIVVKERIEVEKPFCINNGFLEYEEDGVYMYERLQGFPSDGDVFELEGKSAKEINEKRYKLLDEIYRVGDLIEDELSKL